MNLNQDSVSNMKLNSDNSISSSASGKGATPKKSRMHAYPRTALHGSASARVSSASATVGEGVQAQKARSKGSTGTTTLENSFKVEFETFLQQSSFLPQKLVINLIKNPVNTAKSFNAMSKNKQYTFDVDPRLTKSQIKKLFEKLFAVNIVQIQTHIPPRKKITVGNVLGSSQKVKRVILTLKEAQTIQFDS